MPGHDLQMIRLPAITREPALHVAIERLRFVERLVRDEHDFGGLRREFLARFRRTGLHDDGPALRRTRDVERPAHLEVLAAMVEHVQLVGIEIDAAFLVAQEGVVFPAIPQARDDVVEFARAFIAHGMIGMLLEVEVLRLRFRARRHEIPARAAAAQMIERCKFAREIVRLVERGRYGRDQSDVARDDRERRQERQRLEVIGACGAREGREVRIADTDAIGEEDRVELRALGDLRELRVMREVEAAVGSCIGMTPRGDVMPGLHQERAQMHLPLWLLLLFVLAHRIFGPVEVARRATAGPVRACLDR